MASTSTVQIISFVVYAIIVILIGLSGDKLENEIAHNIILASTVTFLIIDLVAFIIENVNARSVNAYQYINVCLISGVIGVVLSSLISGESSNGEFIILAFLVGIAMLSNIVAKILILASGYKGDTAGDILYIATVTITFIIFITVGGKTSTTRQTYNSQLY